MHVPAPCPLSAAAQYCPSLPCPFLPLSNPPNLPRISPVSLSYLVRISNVSSQRHQQFLPDGATRMGFFLGDGAGVGKGRQISGIILDNFARGRKKNVWFSTSTDLAKDAERDLRDLECHIPVIDGCQALDKVGAPAGRPAGSIDGLPWGGFGSRPELWVA